jgi:hypothetical protein
MNIRASGLNCPFNQSNKLGNHPKLGRFSIDFIRKIAWLLTWFPPTLGGLRQPTHTWNWKGNWEASTGAFYDFKWEEPPFWIANIEMFFGGSPRLPKEGFTLWGLDRSQLWLQDFLHGFMTGMIFTGGYHGDGLAQWGDKAIHYEYWLTLIKVLDPNTSDFWTLDCGETHWSKLNTGNQSNHFQ